MNYLIVATLILFTAADQIKCPLEIDTSVSCTKENQPVCAFSLEGYQLGTFENPCFACRAEKASYYELDACIMTTKPSEPINSDSGNNSSTTSNTIYKCDIPKSDSPICPAVYKPTCGLFIPSIQCLKAPCGRSFGNECEACSDKNIESYFYGECEEIPKEDPQNPPDDSITYCTEPRPEICTDEYTDTCAFISTPCFSDSCMKPAGNYCDACTRKDVVGYVKQSCDKYKQVFEQNQNDLDDKQPDSKNDNEAQDLDSQNYAIQQKCNTKPSSCDNVVKEVCATYTCNDTTCQKEYQNECQACLEQTTISYIWGKCQTLSGTILSLALLIQIII
ncbi:unnamed protein product [Paramecium primaurelia]|uniref:Kazal-like domain-containing protein n=1 Tax=Paramecium primaurelia TaxID=5886 RepID=A0A8S1MJU5_PARPR|nr:unnamed protein product [Paramecium primaurelia]